VTTPFWIAGEPVTSAQTAVVRHSFDDSEAGSHYVPSTSDIETAVLAAHDVREEAATQPAHVRAAALDHVSQTLGARAEELARLITAESGKPLKWGNAAVLVCPDWTDLDFAARRIATFAMYQAGQSCISVQRVYAHADIFE
jgi:acyl-CoA reductase-like NAD-dependent aldehyde dehydrogenase